MKTTTFLLSLVAFSYLSTLFTTSAAVIAGWDYDGYRYSPTTPANCIAPTRTLNTQLTGTDLAMHLWGVQSDSDGEFRAYNWGAGSDTFSTSSPYASFMISVNAGYALTLNSFQYVQAWSSDSSAPGLGIWGYRINGGEWVMQSSPYSILRMAPSTLTTWSFSQPLAVSQNIEFAFWAYGLNSPSGGTSYGCDLRVLTNTTGNELVLNGAVAQVTPEPASVALMVLGSAVLIWRVRRKPVGLAAKRQ